MTDQHTHARELRSLCLPRLSPTGLINSESDSVKDKIYVTTQRYSCGLATVLHPWGPAWSTCNNYRLWSLRSRIRWILSSVVSSIPDLQQVLPSDRPHRYRWSSPLMVKNLAMVHLTHSPPLRTRASVGVANVSSRLAPSLLTAPALASSPVAVSTSDIRDGADTIDPSSDGIGDA